jgi:hypothetical protein
VLIDLPRNAWHFCQTLHKYVLVASEEVDELALLFGVQIRPNLNGLGRVFSVNLFGFSILGRFQSTGQGGMVGTGDADGTRRLSSLNTAAMTMAAANSMLSYSQSSAR